MKEILTSMRRTPYQSLAAFMVLFFTLFLSVILFVSMNFLYGFLGYIETRPQVTAYFQPKASENDIYAIREQLLNSGKVLSIKYITKQEAFQVYKNLNKDNPLLLEMVSADILPPSLEVYAKKPSYLPEIASFLKKQGGIDEVNYQKDIIDRLLTLTDILRKITIGFFIFLIIMSIIVLTTTTLFKIALKKDEIELLRLLGATPYYIKRPFLTEGIIYGLTASLTACIIIVGILFYFNPFISSYFKGISSLVVNLPFYQLVVWPLNPIFYCLMVFFSSFFGISIAIIASLLATNKYLK